MHLSKNVISDLANGAGEAVNLKYTRLYSQPHTPYFKWYDSDAQRLLWVLHFARFHSPPPPKKESFL